MPLDPNWLYAKHLQAGQSCHRHLYVGTVNVTFGQLNEVNLTYSLNTNNWSGGH